MATKVNPKQVQELDCPFPHCGKVFKKPYTLKVHLNMIKSQNGNEIHLIADPLWDTVDLEVHQRPGNLTDEEKKVQSSRGTLSLMLRLGNERVKRSFALNIEMSYLRVVAIATNNFLWHRK